MTQDILRIPGSLSDVNKLKAKINEEPTLLFLERENCSRIVAPIFKFFYGSFQNKILAKDTSDIMQFTLGKLKLNNLFFIK